MNNICPVPKGMVGIPLEGAPEVTYYLIVRSALNSKGTEVMRELIAETVRT